MNDIELRWVRRWRTYDGTTSDYMVLQYRKWESFSELSGDRFAAGYRWSDWIDVPTVEE